MKQQQARHKRGRSALRPLTDWRLLLYNGAIVLFAPLFLLRKIRRHFSKRTAYEFLWQRWTIPIQGGEEDDPEAIHVAFVSTGFGEKHTTEQLTAALKELRPNVRTTWAVKADLTVENIRETAPAQAVTYMPFDFLPSVLWWLKRVEPDVVVSVEKLWTANINWCSKLWGAPTLVVSGRSGRYAGRGVKGAIWRGINRWTLRAYEIICLQSETEKQWLAPALPPEVETRITGTIKITRPPSERPTFEELASWVEECNRENLPILAAGSTTDREEEEFVLDAFEKVNSSWPCLLLLAPRRLHRVNELLELLRARGVNVAQRSSFPVQSTFQEAGEGSSPKVLLLDSMGELSSSYRFAEAAFVGGTLRGQGHNVIEPLEWGTPVFYGAGNGDIPPGQALADEAGAGFRVSSSDELAAQWQKVLEETGWREELRERCHRVVAEQKQALEENLKAIVEVVDWVAAEKEGKYNV